VAHGFSSADQLALGLDIPAAAIGRMGHVCIASKQQACK
jgi:hypothetical protein